MAGTGRIYRRGLIYYIAYRWEGREYRESARSSERGVGPSSCWPHGSPSGGGVVPRLHQSSTRWRPGYLDDYGVRRLRTLDTARGRVANLNAAFGGWPSCMWDGLSTSSIQPELPARNLTPDSRTNAAAA